MNSIRSSLALFVVGAVASAASAQNVGENTYYAVDYLKPLEGTRVEVGGMDFLPDGRLIVSTRRGQVWIVDHPLAKNPDDAKFHLFAEGLQDCLGLRVVDGQIYIVQRSELSILRDTDHDDRCDEIETLSNQWGDSGYYHEFAYGLPRDAKGNFYISLNVEFGDPQWWHGRSNVPYRGWIMKVAPDGTTTPVASGFRSPAGLGMNADGDLFATDNQGDWMASCPLFYIREGGFYGHPASLNWTDEYQKAKRTASDTEPPTNAREPAAIWIPYDWARSATEVTYDSTGGKFGPFANQMFIGEMTNGQVVRAQLEKVQGVYQGAVFQFRQHIGSVVRIHFASDGTLFTGFTDRGWGGQAPGDGLARMRWTGVMPMEMKTVHLLQDGFEIEFTSPVKAGVELAPTDVQGETYDYDYWWVYGCPIRRVKSIAAKSLALSADRKKLTLHGLELEPGRCARLKFAHVVAEDGAPLLHDEFSYTINQMPEGPKSNVLVNKLVASPTARERSDEGMLYLAAGDALDSWKQTGWRAVNEVKLDPADPKKLVGVMAEAKDGKPAPTPDHVINDGPNPSELVSRYSFGDIDVHVEFMLPKDGNSGVYLMGRYEVQLRDSAGKSPLDFGDCGGIYEGFGPDNKWPGKAPMFQGFRGPGEWHGLDIRFRAPKFDASGKKIANATFERVMIDDTMMQENVEVPNPTRGGWEGEVASAPLRIQGDHGHVAIGEVRVRTPDMPNDEEGWVKIFDGKSLDGWKISDDGQWKLDNGVIVGSGPRSHLFSPRDDYTNFEFRARCKISDGGNSGMYFRATYGPGWPEGYEAQINSTSTEDPVRTGSLYNLDKIRTCLVPADTWFEQHVICRDVPEGVHITIELNHIVVVDYIDKDKKHAKGHVGLQQHNDGSVVRFKDVEVKELK